MSGILTGSGILTSGGTPRPFDAASISGLAAWYDFSKLGKTLSNGDTVSSVPDQSGNGRTATRVSGNQTYVANGIGGKGAIRWSSGRLESPSFQHFPSTAGTWIMASQLMALPDRAMVLGDFSQASNDWVWYANPFGSSEKLFISGNGLQGIAWADLVGCSNIQLLRRNGAAVDFWVNGIKVANYTVTNSQPGAAKLYIGDGNIWRSADIRVTDVIGYDHAITDAQIKSVFSGLGRKLWSGNPRLVVCDGDSITNGIGSSDSRYAYPVQMRPEISGRYYHLNLGVAGYTLTNLIAQIANRTALAAGYAFDSVYVGWACTNDINDGHSLSSIQTNMLTWINDIRAGGYKYVVIVPPLPRTDISAGKEAVRKTVVDWMRSNWSTFADEFADVTNNWLMADPANTTYYADGIHPTDIGHALNAACIAQAVNRLPQ